MPRQLKIHLDRQSELSELGDCLLFPNLVAQGIDREGNIIATRGTVVYQYDVTDKLFRKLIKLPNHIGLISLLKINVIQKITNQRDIVLLIKLKDGRILCHVGGRIYLQKVASKNTFSCVHTLRFWGLGHGRGILYKGLLQTKNGSIYYGEYFNNKKRS